MRSLSEERHCLVLTVTQIKASGYEKDLLSMNDFSEDKRKFAQVTAMYGLNQTPKQKRFGILRINELVVREGDFDSFYPVTILQRLQMGKPLLEFGISVGRQHLTMGVNHNPFSLACL